MIEELDKTPSEFINNEVKEDIKNIIFSFSSLIVNIITILSNLGIISHSMSLAIKWAIITSFASIAEMIE
ncbi:hypothetical protein Xinn_02931 [Xenorhabdus innexi]|uniref:Uncharacterized protein n=1 Tax=Xenorhabdus innexi TaxID=290109 RepID=A0A2G0N950_9GAMM|nr:hypothetical protein [Xenorhabdus innexi]PHM31222.1 hypothetical protein Xinn_02931 [Xenorhabdus innexi]